MVQSPMLTSQPFSRLETWLQSVPWWLFSFMAIGVAAFKSGVVLDPIRMNDLEGFPYPPNTFTSLSYGFRTFGWVFSFDRDFHFALLGIVLVVIALGLIAALARIKFNNTDGRIIVILVVAGPIGTILLSWIGRNDVLMILGSILVAFSNRRLSLVVPGLVMMIAGNPEQSVLAWLALVTASFFTHMESWRRLALVGLAVSSTALAGLSLLARSLGAGDRSRFLDDYLLASLHNFLSNLPLSIYALFGIMWPVVLVLLALGGRRELIVFFLTFAPAVVVTAITLDQTRVFVGISSLALVAWLADRVPRTAQLLHGTWLSNRLGWVALIALVLPAIEVFGPSGLPRGPFAWVFYSLFGNGIAS